MANVFNILITGFENQGIDNISRFLQEYGNQSHFIINTVSNILKTKVGGNYPKIASVRYLIESSIYSTEPEYKIDDIISPTIPQKRVHLVIGLDPLEVMNNLSFISEQTLVILNTNLNSNNELNNPSVGKIIEILDQYVRRTICMNFEELALIKFNESKFASFIMIGVALKEFNGFFRKPIALKILSNLEIALKPFEIGYNLIS
ncbi:MAG: 2-oxoacid:acceptor oxidoreductase family protein [Promethearchaeota archaeon]